MFCQPARPRSTSSFDRCSRQIWGTSRIPLGTELLPLRLKQQPNLLEHNPQRTQTQHQPTFKIFNAMVALENGVVLAEAVLTWDGSLDIRCLNCQTLRRALKDSNVWFY